MCESYIGATEKSVARIRVSQAGQFIRSMFWIGCIGFGGGSALIPVIEKEIADRQGIDEKQNIDKDVVVASITPGALPVEIAASIGRRKFGIRGMIAGAVMMALPGALMTVALVAVLSVFQEKILSVVNMISIGVSVFILYLLFSYIRKMLKDCGEDGKHRKMKAIFLMLGVFVLSFFISSVQVLILAFFSIFFTRGNYSKRNLIILTGIIGSYLLTHVQVFSFSRVSVRIISVVDRPTISTWSWGNLPRVSLSRRELSSRARAEAGYLFLIRMERKLTGVLSRSAVRTRNIMRFLKVWKPVGRWIR